MSITLLILNAPPELEEDLVDYLLSLPVVEGFTSYQVNGHGENSNLSVAEQVSGRRRRIQYELLTGENAVAEILAGIAANVGRDIVYWQQAVFNSGRI
ncbi:MAG: DUF3240 family protein [Pseudomonadales bacterium]|nr:DUF3240 family protein [Pseudomonadales bacterium]